MNRRYVLASLLATALFVAGWAVAQPGPGAAPKAAGPEVPGRFAVTATANGAVLVDTATGQTWVLRPGVEGPHGLSLPPAWEPVHRIETQEAADKWKEMERKRRSELAPKVGK